MLPIPEQKQPRLGLSPRLNITLAATLAICLGLALFGTVPPVDAASDCRERLRFDEDYGCSFRGDLAAAPVDATLLFEEFDGNAFQATLDLLGETSVAYCTCKTDPPSRFDRAKSFECVTGFAAQSAETFEAIVTGHGGKLNKGQLWSADPLEQGFSRFAFSCRAQSNEDDGGEDGDDGDDGDDGNEKVVICHKGRTKAVNASAVDRHLAHGDTLGPCE